ncbi:AbiJ-NTD4 domain-containing protein [Sphingobacterium faecale]|uniref:HEPN AbiJ-N-terminal domain-containing protein n=1 Tax=Sphingobacterium faecale TaxID=2803775 RepID=A0ABS1R7C4_9SPHI|nr:hypothetical protein [Sphingobacterium faecale]MBL1410109.1 hypothetical protein [Sphingobacterium faecale]
MKRFSKRNGHSSSEKEITTREDAPVGLRQFIPQLLYDLGLSSTSVRETICRVLRVSPQTQYNWGEPNISNEVREWMEECEWFYIYDIIERFHQTIQRKAEFTEEINDYFKANGIGWKLNNGHIVFRGEELFEDDLGKAIKELGEAKLHTAQNEIREAINDLSRRPNPDITGAIQHGVASLECVARDLVGNNKITLGELIKRNREIVPPTIDIIVEKIWGFSSEQGRHLREQGEPSYEEAELMLGLSASISTYLAKKKNSLKPPPAVWDDL